MCIFTGPVDHVGATRIYGRTEPGHTQILAYQMRLTASADVAMVLPIPVPAASPEDALEFISLEDHPRFFDDLARLFSFGMLGAAQGGPAPQSAPLVVETVGAFDASFVPSPADFERLDPRFRIAPEIWSSLPKYADWGFAVFQLRAGHAEVHPMAFRFPTRFPDWVFFPTVHVHDGAVHRRAEFEHVLYIQRLPGAAGDRPDVPRWQVESGWLPLPERFTTDNLEHLEATEALMEAMRTGKPTAPAPDTPRWHWNIESQTGRGSVMSFRGDSLVDVRLPIHRVQLSGTFSNADFAVEAG